MLEEDVIDRRNKTIETQYIHDIAQLTNLSEDKVREVFEYYVLFLVHNIATATKPKGTIKINLPCFCSLLLKENTYANSVDRLQINIKKETKDKRLRSLLDGAYFNNEDPLVQHLLDRFSASTKNDMLEKLKELN